MNLLMTDSLYITQTTDELKYWKFGPKDFESIRFSYILYIYIQAANVFAHISLLFLLLSY